jgi:hypothetical protein
MTPGRGIQPKFRPAAAATSQRLFYDRFTVVTDLPPRSSWLSVVAFPVRCELWTATVRIAKKVRAPTMSSRG